MLKGPLVRLKIKNHPNSKTMATSRFFPPNDSNRALRSPPSPGRPVAHPPLRTSPANDENGSSSQTAKTPKTLNKTQQQNTKQTLRNLRPFPSFTVKWVEKMGGSPRFAGLEWQKNLNQATDKVATAKKKFLCTKAPSQPHTKSRLMAPLTRLSVSGDSPG